MWGGQGIFPQRHKLCAPLHSWANLADIQSPMHPPTCSPVTWDLTFSTHLCALNTHTPPRQAHADVHVTGPHTPLHPSNVHPSHTQAHSCVHVTHAHPPPNTTHRSPRTCAPSEPPVLCLCDPRSRSDRLRRPPPTPPQPGEDCAAKATHLVGPIHSPGPHPSS